MLSGICKKEKKGYLCTAFEIKSNRIVPWCSGSTSDFGSASLGSSPGGTTKKDVNDLIIKLLTFLNYTVNNIYKTTCRSKKNSAVAIL